MFGHLARFDLVHAAPVEDHEQVGVGDAELVAARVLLSLEHLLQGVSAAALGR
jgi:hypothetical protein